MRAGEDNSDTVDRQDNRNLTEADSTAGVIQFIFTSFLGANPGSLVPLFQAKAETEAMLGKIGMPDTFMATTLFMFDLQWNE
jgi:uncharacterized protein YbjT (DUF2867 family)